MRMLHNTWFFYRYRYWNAWLHLYFASLKARDQANWMDVVVALILICALALGLLAAGRALLELH